MPSANSASRVRGMADVGTGRPSIGVKTDSATRPIATLVWGAARGQQPAREIASGLENSGSAEAGGSVSGRRACADMGTRSTGVPGPRLRALRARDGRSSPRPQSSPRAERGPLVRLTPCVEGAFARERDSDQRMPRKLGLAEGDDLGASAGVEVVKKVRAALRRSALGVVAANFVAKGVNVRPMAHAARSATNRSKLSM